MVEAMSRYKRVFREAYNYMQQAEGELERASHEPPEALDRAWEKVSVDGADIIEKWELDSFVIDMMIAISHELYKRYFESGGEC